MFETLEMAMRQSDRGLRVNIVFTDDERIERATVLGFDKTGIAIDHRKPEIFAALIPWTAIFQVEVLQG